MKISPAQKSTHFSVFAFQSLLLNSNTAIIRDLHTYGQTARIEQGLPLLNSLSVQHKGLGKKLIKKAEKITGKEFGLAKIAVIAGVGTRNYYRKLGYRLKNTYMVKRL
ncbi:hypothetical protein COT20_02600 [bacterium (Candidatus Gribaldobacteria) CG08_land_8_20_14_0_20_39_15]|uniref:Uncharacterized protein n=1 Tax=bacterium (Candidatus Gribaldobacteria) CG08_land_8_20_14_0_20_39_15 TaxID=2014273 RepID=A0A2M6XU66_9BACT|nr:MAG: hypothetical protein COT20_02600 [bacterium (Candidatus Gribaldobacteria) CG08_land_8_20_14_0_20_39_15]